MLAFNTFKERLVKIVNIKKIFNNISEANKKVLIWVLLMGGAGIVSGQTDTLDYELPGDGTLWKNGVQIDPKTELDTLPYNKVWRFTDTSGNEAAWGEAVDCDIKSNGNCSAEAEVVISIQNPSSIDHLAAFVLEDANYNRLYDFSIDGHVILLENPLPLNFLSVTAIINMDTLEVVWETVNLIDVEKTEVEISSNNGKDFVPIATKMYKENRIEKSTHQIRITVRDIINKLKSYRKFDPANDEYLIRLKTTNENGTTEVSKMLNIRINTDKRYIAALVVPNPVRQGKSVQLDIFIKNQNQNRIYNTLGKMVASGNLVKGVNNLNTAKLSPGTYFIQIKSGETVKLVVQ